MKVLIVEDDRDLVEVLSFTLKRAGFEILVARDMPTALAFCETEQPDLAILDVGLGAWNGFDVLRRLRERSEMPVIMLTGHTGEADKVQGLNLGADDYITKPFSHTELLARIRAIFRRYGRDTSAPVRAATSLHGGPITMNLAEHAVTKAGQPVKVTVTEFRLLRHLISNAGRVVPTRVLLKEVWGYDDPGGTDVVRVTLHSLRRKLEAVPSRPQLLHTVSGVGLMFKAEPAAPATTA